MALELKVPSVGESITEVQIGEWLKAEGDSVRKDEAVVMIETDKVTVELPAPENGRISKILVKQGATATVGQVVGYLEAGAAAAEPAKAAAPAAPATNSAPAKGAEAPAVMPSAARALQQTGISADQVTGTGLGGRVLKEDVMRTAAQPAAPAKAAMLPPPPSSRPPAGPREEEVVPMTTVRRRIAERLVEAQQTAAMLTTFNEVDMTAVQDLRKKYQDDFVKRYDTKLGFMAFFVKATVDALKQFPAVNAEIRETNIVYKNYCDIGVAVGGGKGLVVPVVRDAERLSFAEIEATIKDFGARAQKNALKLEELQGGTFTITNGGVYGSLLSTPILNPPQSGILGLHGIQERPVALHGQVVIRPMMYIALTYDHRIVDGREAVSFLRRIKDAIEEPTRMLLEV
ncbi:MAG TPA: 2-oxoglutarate dehydrogenase complex dihydrolipoyllysine-residue succinyltransferase [Polyangiaceae bacterium]|nr:2-oxoglutarate dehydrogenase complex dihydrolipoyllysine-residue succinyltransferase [Polyangiaceae bacterium]